MKKFFVVQLLLIIVAGIGWIKDVVHLTQCDFQAPYKAEILYGVVTGTGAIIGWFDLGK